MAYEWERELLKGFYPGVSWIKKVNAMTDSQVIAAYLRLRQKGRKVTNETVRNQESRDK